MVSRVVVVNVTSSLFLLSRSFHHPIRVDSLQTQISTNLRMILLKMKIFTIMTAVLVPSFSNAGAIPPKAFQDPSDISTEIIGGKPVHPPFKYGPWMAEIAKGDYQFCAGTMLTSSILVTAARSSYDAVASFILHFLDCSTVGFPLHTLKVSLHRHNLRRSGKEEGSIDFP